MATEHFRQWYAQTGRAWLRNRAPSLITLTGASPSRVEVRDLGYRWGSCGKNGTLYFSWKAMQLPVRLVDYLVVHELVHLVERRHNDAFTRMMDEHLPLWRQHRQELNAAPLAHADWSY